MAIVTGQNRGRAVPRPALMRRNDSQHEGLVAAIMLLLVVVGIGLFLFWGQLLRAVATNPWIQTPLAVTNRPADGAIPPGPAVVVSLDQPVVASAVVAEEARAAWSGNDAATASQSPSASTEASASPAASDRVVSEQAIAEHDLAIVAARSLPTGETTVNAETAAAPEEGVAHDEAAVAAAPPIPAATLAPTAAPAATAVPRATAVAATPAATAVAGTGKRARVVRTGGRGVVLYSSPRQGARLPAGILEGAIVSVLETSGPEWTRVQGGGQTGWVRSEFLAPAN